MIGVFDSGLGGLTALSEITRLFPRADIVYFGDTGRVPYGTRSFETIGRYARQDIRFLLSRGVSGILAACGTVSSTVLDSIAKEFEVPIVGVVKPAAEAAVKLTKNKKIGAVGTAATIKSDCYQRLIKDIDPEISVMSVPCPLFVPLVENGFTGEDDRITALAAEQYLAPIREWGADTLIMGCTHYPLIRSHISRALPGVALVDPGYEAAHSLGGLINISEGEGKIGYFVSDDPCSFADSAERLIKVRVKNSVETVDIEKF